jgi:hypothetical protein
MSMTPSATKIRILIDELDETLRAATEDGSVEAVFAANRKTIVSF